MLKSVALAVDAKEKGLPAVQLVELDQPRLAYSSYPFTYLGSHARLDRLRKQHRLDDVIADVVARNAADQPPHGASTRGTEPPSGPSGIGPLDVLRGEHPDEDGGNKG